MSIHFNKYKVLIIDNYDSFTYNLVHLVEKIIDEEVTVFLNDDFEMDAVEAFDKIIISPGPSLPKQAGKTVDLIKTYASTKSILGVCLGQQAIVEAFGGKLKNLNSVYHGVKHPIFLQKENHVKENYLFKNLPNKIDVGRYHSWVVDEEYLPKEFIVTAKDLNGEIMAIEHKYLDLQAVQFHPESIMTTDGEQMLSNWLGVL